MTIETKAREWAEKEVPYWSAAGHEKYTDCDLFEKLQVAYLAGAADVVRWVPVTERLPEDDEKVLVHLEDDIILCAEFTSVNGWRVFWRDGISFEDKQRPVTHWMPLPPHPEKEQL